MIKYIEKDIKECTKEDFNITVGNNPKYGCKLNIKGTKLLIPYFK